MLLHIHTTTLAAKVIAHHSFPCGAAREASINDPWDMEPAVFQPQQLWWRNERPIGQWFDQGGFKLHQNLTCLPVTAVCG